MSHISSLEKLDLELVKRENSKRSFVRIPDQRCQKRKNGTSYGNLILLTRRMRNQGSVLKFLHS
ncbi:hypothetical protein C1H46_028873 [Malus baccata]|uniref:Uncharacterized protein n=1 Tax=Malus baccata TaxID=106549 RepID=A0A540LGG0_MALBA|nr:hypothetical protein C1H46_028873 [Malus baccata]